MIVRETIPISFEETRELVRTSLGGHPRKLAIQAGHFMLYHDTVEDQLVPCVSPLLTAPRHSVLKKSLGNFPVLSWNLAMGLMEYLDAPETHVLVLVNDWQYCPPGIDRGPFFQSHSHLPPVFAEPLAASHGRVKLLTPSGDPGNHSAFFSELTLRNQYRRRLKKMIKDGDLPEGATLLQEEDGLTCSIDDILGRREAIYCSSKGSNCTMEVAELIKQVSDRTGCTGFLNFFPGVCREFVMAGTELAFRLFTTTITDVINIALPATDLDQEADFWTGCRAIHHRNTRAAGGGGQ